MLSKVSSRLTHGVPYATTVVRASQMTRYVAPSVCQNVPNVYIQQRSFGKFSDFTAAFKEEYAKAKKEAAEKTAEEKSDQASAQPKNESTSSPEQKGQNTEETVKSTTKENTEETAKSSVKENAEKVAKEASEKMKAKMEDSTQKLKDGLGEATKEAKEQLKEGTKKLSSFWSDFSSEMKSQLNIKSSKPTPKKVKKAKAKKSAPKMETKVDAAPAAAAATEKPADATAEKPADATAEKPVETTKDVNAAAATATDGQKIESVESLEAAGEEEEEELDPMSDEALGITPEMSEEEADEIRKEAKRKQIKAENYEKKKSVLRDTLRKSKERAKVHMRSITWDSVKHFLRDGWNDIKGSNQKPHRVLLDEEEVEKQRAEILKARDDAEKLKEEHEKSGKPMKTDLMNVDNSANIWAQVADLLKDAPLIESLLEMGKKVKESKVGETVSYATEDFREKWETSQHPLVYKLSAVYDELFSESDTAKAIKEVRRTDPTFLEDALRDEMKHRIVPAMLRAWVNADTKTLKLVMSDHAYAQVYSIIKMQQAEGLEMDKNILDIKDIQLQSAHVMERQNPAFLYLVTVQMVNCIRDKEGHVVQGKEDEIKQMYYYMALQQEHDDELNIMRWKIAEMQLVGEMDTW